MAEDINFSIGLDSDSARRSLKRFQSSAEKAFSGIQGSLSSLNTLAIGFVGVLAGREIVQGLSYVTAAAATQEDAIKRLNTALKLAGDFSSDASQDLQTFASLLQETTAIGDDTILGLLALAKSFNVTNEGAKELVTAAANLSAQTGIELESAVRNLGKSLSGLSGELGESVAGIRDLTQEQLIAGGAIDLVNQRFQGAAAAAAQTYSGSIQSLAGNFGDLQEEIGFLITKNPVLIELVQQLSEGFKDLGSFISENSDEISDGLSGAIVAVTRQAPKLVMTLGAIGKAGIIIARSFNETDRILSFFFSNLLRDTDDVAAAFKLLTSPVNTFVLGLVEVEKFVKRREIEELSDQVSDISSNIEDLGKELDGNEISLREYAKATQDAQRQISDLNKQIETAQEEIDTLNQVGQDVAIEIDVDSQKLADDLQVRVTEAEVNAVNLDKAQKELDELVTNINEGIKPVADALERAGDNLVNKIERANFPQPGDRDFVGPLPESPDKPGATASFGGLDFGFFADLIGDFGRSVQSAGQNFEENVGAVSRRFTTELLQIAGSGVGETQSILDERAALEKEIADFTKENADIGSKSAEEQEKFQEQITAFKERELALAKKQEQLNRQGASQILGSGIGAIADVLAPGLGQVLGPLATDLSQGGAEAAITFVNGIVDALPFLIDALVEATPAIIVALAERADDIIIALAVAAPRVAIAIAENLDVILAGLAESVVNVLSDAVGVVGDAIQESIQETVDFGPTAKEFAIEIREGILDGFIDARDKIIDGLKGFFDDIRPEGGVLGSISDVGGSGQGVIPDSVPILGGLATGGLVGGTGRGDSQLFALEPGELVVDRSTSGRLLDFVNRSEQQSGGDQNSDLMIQVLAQILAAVKEPTTVQTTAEVNGEALADIILTLNRANKRLGA